MLGVVFPRTKRGEGGLIKTTGKGLDAELKPRNPFSKRMVFSLHFALCLTVGFWDQHGTGRKCVQLNELHLVNPLGKYATN